MGRPIVSISLVIPTYRREQMAIRALDSARQQSLTDFELIVVDNAPQPELKNAVQNANSGARIPARYVHEPRLGLHNARHAGARAASGDVLVFTDDDATFAPGWLAAYARAFEDYAAMAAAGGRILPDWQAPPPDWLCALMNADPSMFPALSLLDLSPRFRLGTDGFFFGVNMAIRRKALFEAGGFNPEIFGNRWLGDGETGLNRKLWANGELIGYVPDAVVYHLVTRERMTLEYLRKRQGHEGACDMYALFHPRVPGRPRLAVQALAVIREAARDWAAEPLLRGRTDPRALRVQLRAARARARLQYVVRLMLSPTLRALVRQEHWL